MITNQGDPALILYKTTSLPLLGGDGRESQNKRRRPHLNPPLRGEKKRISNNEYRTQNFEVKNFIIQNLPEQRSKIPCSTCPPWCDLWVNRNCISIIIRATLKRTSFDYRLGQGQGKPGK
jgi:hypothetical protein